MTTLCLDTEIIPAKYGKALLNVMYMDTLDMRMVHDSTGGGGGGASSRYHPSMLVTPTPPHHTPMTSGKSFERACKNSMFCENSKQFFPLNLEKSRLSAKLKVTEVFTTCYLVGTSAPKSLV